MSQDPEAIRQNIEQTRTSMGETVEAIAYKTDFPSRARDSINERIETIKGKVSDTFSSASDAVAAMPNPAAGLRTAGSIASANPLGLAIGAVAVGFLVGLCLPVSDLERERVGKIGEQMTEQAKSAAAGAIEQGKAVVTQAIGDVISGNTQTQA